MPKHMNIRITNDGGPAYHTLVTNAETGEPITNAFRFELDVSRSPDLPIATLYLYTPLVDWSGEVEVVEVDELEGSLVTALNAAYYANQHNSSDFRANEAYRVLTELTVGRVTFDPSARVYRKRAWRSNKRKEGE